MTVGDPRGIGPEIVAKALADPRVGERCDVVVVGPDGAGVNVEESIGVWSPGGSAADAGRLSGLAIERAVAMATAGEVDGIDYNFITRARFEQMIASGAFLEWADVFGNLYGTCAADAETDLAAGRDLVLVIDVQGARQVRVRCPGTVGVFVLPPSFPILESRLRGRSADSEQAMQRRLQTARDEVAAFTEYDYVVVNDELEACVDRLRAIVLAERARLRSMRVEAEEIVKTFLRQ